MQIQNLTKQKTRVIFLFVLAVCVTLLFVWIIKGFLLALIMGTTLACLAHPFHRRLVALVRGRKSVAAALTVLLTLGIVIVPTLLFLGVLVHEAVQTSDRVAVWLETHLGSSDKVELAIQESPVLRKLIPYQDQIVGKAGELAERTASFIAQMLVAGTRGTAEFFLMLFVALYAMFYFLKDGRAVRDRVLGYTPLSAEDKQRLVATFASVARATLKGTLVIGIVQGGLAGTAFAVVGIDGALLWGAIMVVLSIIPGVGTGLVWVPAVVYLALVGRSGAAIGLAVWCGVVVGTADNVLRPLLIGKDTEMSDLMVLLTTLGGMVLFGAAGIVIGPVVGALFSTVWALWGAAMTGVQPGGEPSSAGNAH